MKPKIKVADLAKALQGIETDRQLTKEIVEDAKKVSKLLTATDEDNDKNISELFAMINNKNKLIKR